MREIKTTYYYEGAWTRHYSFYYSEVTGKIYGLSYHYENDSGTYKGRDRKSYENKNGRYFIDKGLKVYFDAESGREL